MLQLNIDLYTLSVGASQTHVYILFHFIVTVGNGLINMWNNIFRLLLVVLALLLHICSGTEKTEVRLNEDLLCHVVKKSVCDYCPLQLLSMFFTCASLLSMIFGASYSLLGNTDSSLLSINQHSVSPLRHLQGLNMCLSAFINGNIWGLGAPQTDTSVKV